MRKLNILLLCVFFIFSINLISADVTLNSPSNGEIVYTNEVTFNATGNITTGNYIANATLYTNETGSWSGEEIELYSPEYHNLDLYDNFNDNSINTGLWSITGSVSESSGTLRLSGNGVTSTATTTFDGKTTGGSFQGNIVSYTADGGSTAGVYITDGTSETSIGLTNYFQIYFDKFSQTAKYRTSNDGIIWGNWSSNIDLSSYSNYYIRFKITTGGSTALLIMDNTYSLNNKNSFDGIMNKTFNAGNKILWNMQFCDSDGDCGFATSNYTFSIDSTAPTIDLSYPTPLTNYGKFDGTLELNFTATDFNLDSVWYDYNGTNFTISGAISGEFNQSNITLSDKKNVTIYANDTAGNLAMEVFEWDYKVFENSRTHNLSSYETAYETYSINVTANSSLTGVNLLFNGTSFQMTNQGSGIWTYSRDLPSSIIGTNNFYYQFTYGGDTINSDISSQVVSSIVFNICDATYTTPFLNLTFKDEEDSSTLNASIPSSTWVYYLGSGLVNKTYTYSNTSLNYNYTFCATPTDRVLNIDPYIQYKQDPNYPQRIWDLGVQQYNSSLTTQNLYLLNSADGIYVTFQVINLAEQSLEGVVVNATRIIDGSEVLISSGTTGSAGTITFLLNPDFTHTFNFYLEGYPSLSTSLAPTSSSYTITLGGESSSEESYLQGISFLTSPSRTFLDKNTIHNFSLSLSSIYWDLDEWGFNLSYSNGTLIGSNSSNIGTGGTLYIFDVNVSNSEAVVMQGYYILNGTTYLFNLPRIWKIQETDGTEFSIFNFFNRVNAYTEAEFFGISNFGKLLISAILLISTAGIMTSRYGINSEATITGIIFSIVFLLEVGLEFIPPITIPATGITLPRGILTAITFIVTVALLIREESR